MLKKRDAIIVKIKARKRKNIHKYGIEIPRSAEHAYELDKRNGDIFCRKAIEKGMFNVGVPFQKLEKDEATPIGWKTATEYTILDVKMNFTRKAT